MKELKYKRLNLGCGWDKREGYVNVDLNAFHDPDVLGNAIELNAFPSCYYQEVYAQDVLEHVTRADARKALFEWNRLLGMDGQLFIRTTSVTALARLMESPANQAIPDQERLVQNLFGTQAYNGDFHLSGFTEATFRFYMWEAGFEIERIWLLHEAFLEAWGKKVQDHSYQRLIHEIADDDTFVRQAYEELLGRPATEEEFARDREALRDPKTIRLTVVRNLLLSEERKNRMIARAPRFKRTLNRAA